jgi:two-component system phosphate regulon sensor histidine kinase PhoR
MATRVVAMPKIQQRLLALLAGSVLASAVLAGVWIERGLRERERAHVESWLAATARTVAEWAGDVPFDAAHSAELEALTRRARVASGARGPLIAPDGTVVADSEIRPEDLANVANHGGRAEIAAARALGQGAAVRRSETVGSPFHYVAVARPEGRPPGVVRLAADLSAVEAAVADLREALFVGAGVALAAALTLSWALSRSLLRPLAHFRTALARISAGDLGARVRWRSNDELGELAGSLDRMAGELERSHAEITAERDRLQTVLRVMVEGVLVVDAQARIVLANPRLRELFGTRGEIEGLPPLAAIRHAGVDDALRAALASSAPVHRELELSGPERRVLAVHAASFALGDAKGAVAVFHDMTEVRRLETVRRDFVANASHEIKTPLTAIRGFAETLLSSELPARDARSYLEIILRHSERLSRLVEDLLELSRLESGKFTLEPEPLDVGALAAKLLRELEPRLRERSIAVSLHAEGAPRAVADVRAVEQVLQNLLDNAVKYSEPGRSIAVRVSADGPAAVRVDVADQGIGIPEAERARIFERFYRVDRARSREQGGTGLGLSIVKHLVQASGGEVWVESAPGAGSTFSFTLPSSETRRLERSAR